jgi:hypothetical protein
MKKRPYESSENSNEGKEKNKNLQSNLDFSPLF